MDATPDPEADLVVSSLRSALLHGGSTLGTVPGLLKRVLKEKLWKDRIESRTRERVQFARFVDFVSTPPLEGLGTDLDVVRRLIRDDVEAEALFDAAVQNPPGNPTGANQHESGTVDNINGSKSRPDGTSRQYALRKLRTARPDLLQRVENGELSPNAAMIEAGFRKRETPLDTLRRAWRKASAKDRRAFLDEVEP